ncbi:MAG: hypothetical protein U0U09_10395 [Cyclobacteriaceae bacterium]
MKNYIKSLFLALIVLSGCGKSTNESSGSNDSLQVASKALYSHAMDIHDEVMPKMDELYRLKQNLKDTLASPASLSPETKADFETRIHMIDSAEKSMMDWMHDNRLRPIQDTTDLNAYQQYMKGKVEAAEKMKSLMLEAIAKAKL